MENIEGQTRKPADSKKRQRITLNEQDISEIKALAGTNLDESDIIATLENNNPLNRLVRDVNNKITTYLGCVDQIDSSKERKKKCLH
ncbi:MAG: hypothetical protein K9L98_02615 [Candidatus Pacebacteria bacterium]|nr:hypothetical protein [Candidatus Paceibacterota bacterium]MCF7862877.1 hypothetical protein [Candidatus Paceibacterota bacterium]